MTVSQINTLFILLVLWQPVPVALLVTPVVASQVLSVQGRFVNMNPNKNIWVGIGITSGTELSTLHTLSYLNIPSVLGKCLSYYYFRKRKLTQRSKWWGWNLDPNRTDLPLSLCSLPPWQTDSPLAHVVGYACRSSCISFLMLYYCCCLHLLCLSKSKLDSVYKEKT